MKRLILILTINLIATICPAREGYIVYKVSGAVEIFRESGWSVLERRDTIRLKDRLRLAEGARIGILDDISNRIYYSEKKGEQFVANIISTAKRNSDAVSGQMNKQIRQAMTGDSPENTFNSVGASYRGETGTIGITEKLHASIYMALDSPDNIIYDDNIIFQKTPVNEGEFCFTVENRHDKTLCVNILAIRDNGQKPYLCFNVGYIDNEPYILVLPHTKIILNQFLFAEESETNGNIRYLPFASENPFDVQKLQLYLNRGMNPMCKEDFSEIIFSHLCEK